MRHNLKKFIKDKRDLQEQLQQTRGTNLSQNIVETFKIRVKYWVDRALSLAIK